MKRIPMTAWVLGAALAVTMTGCSGDDDGDSGDEKAFADGKPADIVDAATKAMTELDSLKVVGSMRSEGQQATIDIQMASDSNCTGSLSFNETGKLEILGVDGERWFKGDEAFWSTTGVPDAATVADKWVVDSEDDFAQFCDVKEFVDGLFDDDTEETYELKGTEDVDGDEVVVVEQTDDEDGVSTGFILTDEPHYMVKIDKEGDDGGTVTFSEFDEEFDVTAPSEDEIAQLG
jgi:hypothetical protein